MATLTQPPQDVAMPNTLNPFTCNTCGVAFRTSDVQRAHMQSDWHRYNLKRRVASLPPLSSAIFAEKVLANKASAAATEAKARFEKRCEACLKTFYSEGAYRNHLGSQKHKILSARLESRQGFETGTESLVDSTFSLGEPMETASTTTESTINGEFVDARAEEEFEGVVEGIRTTGLDDGAEDPLSARPERPTPSTAVQQTEHPLSPAKDENEDEEEHKANLNQCLFCNYTSPTLALNEAHMSKAHGMFIPERDYLVDLEGLINYLSETIMVLHQCLFCHKIFSTAPGVQTHMRDRGHCMIAYSTEDEQLEVGEYYDFRSTYSDEETDEEEDAEEANGGVSLGVKRDIKTTTQDEDGEDVDMEDDEDWESDSSLSSVPTDEITSVPIDRTHTIDKLPLHRHHSHTDPRPHKNSDGFHSHAHRNATAVYHDEYELHLPSGRTAGHRSLQKFYRQNLRNYPTPEERREQHLLESGRHVSDDEGESTGANDADDEDDDDRTETDGPTRGRQRQLISRANGGLGMVGVSEVTKRQVATKEKREVARARRKEERYQWGKERRANFQKHYRDPLLQ